LVAAADPTRGIFPVDFALTPDQQAIRSGRCGSVRALSAMTTGWSGISKALPARVSQGDGRGRLAGDHHAEEYGEQAWCTEAAIMMHTVASFGGGFTAASRSISTFSGRTQSVVHGTPEQKKRWLVPLIKGEEQTCFGVTEADAGLDTTSIKTFARRTDGGYLISGGKIWTSTAQVREQDRLACRIRKVPLMKSWSNQPPCAELFDLAELRCAAVEIGCRRALIRPLGRRQSDFESCAQARRSCSATCAVDVQILPPLMRYPPSVRRANVLILVVSRPASASVTPKQVCSSP